MSQFETAALQSGPPDSAQWSKAQGDDPELQRILANPNKCALRLQARDTPYGPIYADFSTGTTRTYVPAGYRRSVFDALHGLSHGGQKATSRLINARYCWPDIDRQVSRWVSVVYSVKTGKHTVSPIVPFSTAERRFGHIHIDLVGPLPSLNGNKYLLTCIDRYTRWPEAWPLENMSAHAVAVTLVNQ